MARSSQSETFERRRRALKSPLNSKLRLPIHLELSVLKGYFISHLMFPSDEDLEAGAMSLARRVYKRLAAHGR
jgi:hypothetical protein